MTDHNPTGEAFRQFEYLTLPLTVGADHTNRMLRAALARAFGAEQRS